MKPAYKPYDNPMLKIVKSIVDSYQPNRAEPKPANFGTIKTRNEFIVYLALNGVLGREAYLATIEAVAKTPELTGYLSSEGLTVDDKLIENRRLEMEIRPQSMMPRLVKKKKEDAEPQGYVPREEDYQKKNYGGHTYNTGIAEKELFGIMVEAFARMRQGKFYDRINQPNSEPATYSSNNFTETELPENTVTIDRYRKKPKKLTSPVLANQGGLENLLAA